MRRLGRVAVALGVAALGVAALGVAALAAGLVLALRGQIPWPFPWVPSLEAAGEDPDILREVERAGLAAGLGVGLLGVAGVLARRTRWPALLNALAGLAAIVWALPHLQPLFVPAVPTVFYRSPTGFAAASILAGQAMFGPHCAVCHGAQGRGDGPAAARLAVPPADLTAEHLWMHRDGELFWWLSHGMEGPDGARVMPGFAHLDAASRWALIDYIRGHNAGLTLSGGRWGTQVLAPDFAIACPDGAARFAALRGRTVRVILSPDAAGLPGVTTVALGDGPPSPGLCRVREADVAAALAVVAPGAGAVLVDANGWLRVAAPSADGLSGAIAGVAAAALPVERPAMAMDAGMEMQMNPPMRGPAQAQAPAQGMKTNPSMTMPPAKTGAPDEAPMKPGMKM